MATATIPEESPEAQGAGRRDRSPNYPSLTFSDALERARKIWDAEQRHAVSPELAAKHAGYSKLNGASTSALAALKRYGLLEAVPGSKDVKITNDAHFVFVHPADDGERIELIKKLAMKPELFHQVLEKYPDGLPSDANLRGKLRTTWNFGGDDAANSFIRALREAVSIQNPPVQTEVATPVAAVDNTVEPNKEHTVSTPQQFKAPAQPQVVRSPVPVDGIGGQPRTWNLGDGVAMTVILPPGGLTKKNIERLKKYVEALAMEASIAWDEEEDDAVFGGLPET